MARILEDAYTAANATALTTGYTATPGPGGTYSAVAGLFRIQTNRIYNTGSSSENALAYNATTFTPADYYGEAELYKASAIGQTAGAFLRYNSAAVTAYGFMYNDATGVVQIQEMTSGNAVTLASSAAQTFNVSDSHRLGWLLDGPDLVAYWDDVEVASASDGSITAAGRYAPFINYVTGTGSAAGVQIAGAWVDDDLTLAGGGGASFSVTFAGTVPLQTLAAGVSHTAPDFPASFAATVPLASLAATVGHVPPDFPASFAATVPLQALAAEITVAAPGFAVQFAATVPLQALAASVSRTFPDFPATFAGAVPTQSLAAVVEVIEPGYSVSFAGTVPLQSLAATLERTVPDFAADFAGAVPMSTLAAALFNGDYTAAEGYLTGTIAHAPALTGTITRGHGLSATVSRRSALSATITRRP